MDAQPVARAGDRPTVALALGGGAARGIAHIAMLEAFDELSIRPKVIAGCSIGAIVGACYAAGLSASEIRAHFASIFARRRALLAHVLKRLPGHVTRLWSPRHPTAVNGATALEMLLPEQVNTDFAHLAIPLRLVAVDYATMEPVVLSTGRVIPAVAASASLPSLARPVEIDGRVLFDGGFANPTPFDVVQGAADITVAVDVGGRPDLRKPVAAHSKDELWDGAIFALFNAVVREKEARRAPDILLRPDVGLYRTLDFPKMNEILARSAPEKQRLRQFLAARVLGAPAQGISSTT
ncbi:MAG: patatin-like phospholipase family protein [Hyphomicrobiaceae bacterium]